MAFLRRDFIHADESSWRKRTGAVTLFSDTSGKLISAYSYNTALASVEPDPEQVSGIRIYLNISKYSKCSNEHMYAIRARLRADYDDALEFAAEADNVPVGTNAATLRELCGVSVTPTYVRERAQPNVDHLTMRDLRRTFHNLRMLANADGSRVHFVFTTADEGEFMLTVENGELDYEADSDAFTLSPDAYAHVIATQGKLAALAKARGTCRREDSNRSWVDMTYSQRAFA